MTYAKIINTVDVNGNPVQIPVALGNMIITDSGNLEISSDAGTKINIESGDNEAHKPMGKVQLDTNHYADPDDKKKFKLAVICDKKGKVEGMNIEAAGIDFETANADEANGWKKNQFRLRFKGDNGADTYADTNMHFRSLGLRARAVGGAGNGGGIAVQIASCDSDYHENKFKIETDRIAPISNGAANGETYAQTYNGEGGKGMEIFTMNSQHMSAWAGDYRFNADAKIYPSHRGALVTDPTTGKVDFPTQSDDFKDLIASDGITWEEIYMAVKYIKATAGTALNAYKPFYPFAGVQEPQNPVG